MGMNFWVEKRCKWRREWLRGSSTKRTRTRRRVGRRATTPRMAQRTPVPGGREWSSSRTWWRNRGCTTFSCPDWGPTLPFPCSLPAISLPLTPLITACSSIRSTCKKRKRSCEGGKSATQRSRSWSEKRRSPERNKRKSS